MRSIALGLALLLLACAPRSGPQQDSASDGAGPASSAEPDRAEPAREAAEPAGGPADMPLDNSTDRVMPPMPHEISGDGADACGASRYRYLIGRHRSRIPAKPAGETWRVTCTSCPMTMDYSERRLNILYDQRSGTVEEVRCG